MKAVLFLSLLALLLTACTVNFQGAEYNAVRSHYGVWIWIERSDGTYDQWMINPAQVPFYHHYVNGKPAY